MALPGFKNCCSYVCEYNEKEILSFLEHQRLAGDRSASQDEMEDLLDEFVTKLRHQQTLRNVLTEHQVRIGLRTSDAPPADVERRERYGPTVRGQHSHTNFTAKRVNALAPPVRSDRPVPTNRRGDREQNVKDYWDTQTPQAHHIVESSSQQHAGPPARTQQISAPFRPPRWQFRTTELPSRSDQPMRTPIGRV